MLDKDRKALSEYRAQTAYTYNMLLGTVSSQTDNDGNITYFEYDNLGRNTRIIYPKYAAYSDYDEKNIQILPVTNIEYVTAARTDYAGTPDEKLIAQAIHTTQRYYDVSELEKAVPTDEELSDCSLYYIGDEIDYYMGTGELIEENILDNVGGTLKYLTTGYVYDTKKQH